MRDRLIELIKESFDKPKYEFYTGGRNCAKGYVSAETIADYLLDNGIIVLPCKVGDTVWEIRGVRWKGYDWKFPVYDNASVTGIKFNLEMLPRIGRKTFLTKEEAEAKLAELKGTEE